MSEPLYGDVHVISQLKTLLEHGNLVPPPGRNDDLARATPILPGDLSFIIKSLVKIVADLSVRNGLLQQRVAHLESRLNHIIPDKSDDV